MTASSLPGEILLFVGAVGETPGPARGLRHPSGHRAARGDAGAGGQIFCRLPGAGGRSRGCQAWAGRRQRGRAPQVLRPGASEAWGAFRPRRTASGG